MEALNIIIPIVTLLLGGGGTWLLTIKSTKKEAEASAMDKVQEIYQELITDMKEDRDAVKAERDSAKEDLNKLIPQYKELENKLTELENVRLRQLEETVEIYDKMLKQLAEYAKKQATKCKNCILIELINNSQS